MRPASGACSAACPYSSTSARTPLPSASSAVGESRRASASSTLESPGDATQADRRCRIASSRRPTSTQIFAARSRVRARAAGSSVRAASCSHVAIRCSGLPAAEETVEHVDQRRVRGVDVERPLHVGDGGVDIPVLLRGGSERAELVGDRSGVVMKRRRAHDVRARRLPIASRARSSRPSSSSARQSTLGTVGARAAARSGNAHARRRSSSLHEAMASASSSSRAARAASLVSIIASSSSRRTSAPQSPCAAACRTSASRTGPMPGSSCTARSSAARAVSTRASRLSSTRARSTWIHAARGASVSYASAMRTRWFDSASHSRRVAPGAIARATSSASSPLRAPAWPGAIASACSQVPTASGPRLPSAWSIRAFTTSSSTL